MQTRPYQVQAKAVSHFSCVSAIVLMSCHDRTLEVKETLEFPNLCIARHASAGRINNQRRLSELVLRS